MSPLKARLTAVNTPVGSSDAADSGSAEESHVRRILRCREIEQYKTLALVLVRMTAQIEQLEMQKEEQEQHNVGPV